MFRVVNYGGRKNSMQIELIKWDLELAISRIERKSKEEGCSPSFTCSLPSTWVKSWEKFHEFDSLSYISPYTDLGHLVNELKESEKRIIGLSHELRMSSNLRVFVGLAGIRVSLNGGRGNR
ncbi:putative plant organelle RNA recognition domain-containing protein [Helianthus annuus]|nr:putative plant organelle RNA recognition domain-containing protein [Helianthus annuus]